jgi:hypothetical protein
MDESGMKKYQRIGEELFQSVGQSLGIHVLLLIIEHALWQTKQKNGDAILITYTEAGISFDELAKNLDPVRAEQAAHELITAIVSALGKLVGIQIVNQLTEQLQ